MIINFYICTLGNESSSKFIFVNAPPSDAILCDESRLTNGFDEANAELVAVEFVPKSNDELNASFDRAV